MKFLLFFVLLISVTGFAGPNQLPKVIPPEYSKPDELQNGLYFSVYKKTLISTLTATPLDIDIFGDLFEDRNRVRKVPSSVLTEIGLKKGDSVQYVDLVTKEIGRYEIKDHIFILFFQTALGERTASSTAVETYWYRYTVILSDDPKEHERLKKIDTDLSDHDGFAYVGKQMDFTKGKFNSIKLEKLNAVQLKKEFPLLDSKKIEVRNGKCSDVEVFVLSSLDEALKLRSSITVKSKESKRYGILSLPPAMLKGDRSEVLTFMLNDGKCIFPTDYYMEKYECTKVIVLDKGSVSEPKIECIDDNRLK